MVDAFKSKTHQLEWNFISAALCGEIPTMGVTVAVTTTGCELHMVKFNGA